MALGAGSLIKGTIRLERELGQGAMGVVWVAHHESLQTNVAVKVLKGEARTDTHRRARFEQEARGVAQIDSPHVVRIFDYGFSDEGEPFIVMELLRGSDLGALLQAQGRLPLAQTASMLGQLCKALGRAHELGIVHRDIKPQNVFLQDVGGEPFVKVLDFGVAKQTHDDRNMTASGALVGTPYYMSPEQLVGAKDIDHRADLWSLAVVAYVCLTGQPPFHGETVGALTMAVHDGRFVLPTQHDSGLPGALDGWFQRALMVDPNARYQSAAELSRALDAAVASATHGSVAEHGAAQQQQVHGPAVVHGAPSTHVQGSNMHASWAHASTVAPNEPIALQPATHAALAASTAGGLAASTPGAPPQKQPSRAPLFIGLFVGVVGIGALVTALVVVPQLQDSSSEGDRSDKRDKRKKKKRAAKATESAEPASDATDSGPAKPFGKPAVPSKRAGPSPPSPSPPSKPAPKTVVSAGLEGTLRSCWVQANNGSFIGKASSATVTVSFSGDPRPTRVFVSGPAASFEQFRSCVQGVGFQKSYPQRVIDAGTAVSSASLPACEVLGNGLIDCSGK